MLFRLTEIRKSYGGTEVLRGVSFQLNQGEKVGLVGRNGAGKTTLFRIITGAESPDVGEVVAVNNLKIGILDQQVDFVAGATVHTAALSAFREVHDIEAEMRGLERRMQTDHSDATLNRYADLQIAFERAGGFTYAARAEAILLGLGFPKDTWDAEVSKLSGGQMNRLAMARLLLCSADVLLLDEPTNHLDVGAVEWLETFLQGFDKAYVIISHDRYFLDRTTDRIIEIENGRAEYYKGNYSKYVAQRDLRREHQRREYENQQSRIAKTEEFIRRNIEGQKVKQAKSRRNMLERLERIDAVATERHGGSFVLRRVERTGHNVLSVEDLSVGYGSKCVACGINLSVHRGEALGIIGGNGTGKTTFLRTILGELPALGGEFHWGTKTSLGYYSQNLEGLEPRNEVMQELRRVAPMAESGEVRSFLARFLFFGDDVFKIVAELSGGEKGRLALAKLIYSRKNVLILDEPTNHLDIPAREALEDALKEYEGTIITVSHDRFFLDKIATQIVAFEATGVETFNGNYTEYHGWKLAAIPTASSTEKSNPDEPGRHSAKSNTTSWSMEKPPQRSIGDVVPSQRIDASLSKNQRERMTERIAQTEEYISECEDRIAKLTAEMSLPEIAADFSKLSTITGEIKQIEERSAELYLEWESLAEQLR